MKSVKGNLFAVQIKGKLKTTIEAPHNVDQKIIETMALSEPAVAVSPGSNPTRGFHSRCPPPTPKSLSIITF